MTTIKSDRVEMAPGWNESVAAAPAGGAMASGGVHISGSSAIVGHSQGIFDCGVQPGH